MYPLVKEKVCKYVRDRLGRFTDQIARGFKLDFFDAHEILEEFHREGRAKLDRSYEKASSDREKKAVVDPEFREEIVRYVAGHPGRSTGQVAGKLRLDYFDMDGILM